MIERIKKKLREWKETQRIINELKKSKEKGKRERIIHLIKECFGKWSFSVCPLNTINDEYGGFMCYSILSKFHCNDFKNLDRETIENLKRLVLKYANKYIEVKYSEVFLREVYEGCEFFEDESFRKISEEIVIEGHKGLKLSETRATIEGKEYRYNEVEHTLERYYE